MSARQVLRPKLKVGILREHRIEKVPVSQICHNYVLRIVQENIREKWRCWISISCAKQVTARMNTEY